VGFKTFTVGEVLTASDVNDYLMEQAVISCTSGTRPSSPNEGMTIYETDTDSFYYYNGGWITLVTPWTAYSPTFTAVSGSPSMGTGGFLLARYQQVGKTVHYEARGLFGTGASAGTGGWSFSLPVAAATTSNIFRIGSAYCRDTSAGGSGHFASIAVIDTSTPTVLNLFNVTGQVGSAYPFTWVATDHFAFSITYEAA
jgi:hypothetical protein